MDASPARIAVVIPCYRHERFVAQAVESALGQTRRPDRLIVIDDGSPDGSVDVLERFRGEEGVELIVQANAGAHNAINRGVRLAADDCTFVAILNSDDVYAPDRLERCLEFLEAHPEFAVACTRFDVVDGEGEPLDPEAPRARWFRAAWSPGTHGDAGADDLVAWLGTANFPGTTSNIVARAEYLVAKPFRAFRFCHDYFFLAEAAIENRLGLVDHSLLHYRVHGANTMDTDPAPLIRELLRMQLELYRSLGYEVMAQPALRERFERFVRAGWNNVSAFHAGLFQALAARLVATASDDEVQEVLAVLSESDAPELHAFPNRTLVKSFDGSKPITVDHSVVERLEKLEAEHRALKEEHHALRELARIRQKLLASKRVSLARLLGKARGATTDRGRTASEKLDNLRDAIEADDSLRDGLR